MSELPFSLHTGDDVGVRRGGPGAAGRGARLRAGPALGARAWPGRRQGVRDGGALRHAHRVQRVQQGAERGPDLSGRVGGLAMSTGAWRFGLAVF